MLQKLIILVLYFLTLVRADWTAIAAYSKRGGLENSRNRRRSATTQNLCNSTGLTGSQKELCQLYPKEIFMLSTGVELGVKSCESLLKNSMWNCPNKFTDKQIKFLGKKNTKEIGFSTSLLSAAGMAVLHDACRRGDISSCDCSLETNGRRNCEVTAAIRYGYAFSKNFIDVENFETYLDFITDEQRSLRSRDASARKREKRAKEEKWLKLYNAEIGRFIVSRSSKEECKCFGVSGSCTEQQCTERIDKFGTIAADIYKAYKQSKRVRLYKDQLVDRRDKRRVYVDRDGQPRGINRKSQFQPRILYTRRNQDFCRLNDKGVYLNVGRECDLDTNTANSCDRICCSYGHNAITETQTLKENCVFNWGNGPSGAGQINCEEKKTETTRYTCKSPIEGNLN